LHRWHHSRDLREGNKNYGENLMIWDHIFRTWINPDRRPPANIGIAEDMPAGFLQQLAWPFKKRAS
jgi:sterol desaturase/sphingolipid hydroxylase (fatty acid hydroxylase superfamily)